MSAAAAIEAPVAPIVRSVVDADTIHEETPSATVIETQLQRILAKYCVVHRAQSYVVPNMFKCLLERLFPSNLQLNAWNTVFYTALSKRFNIKAKTTNSCVADTSPSKHETMGGTPYRNLADCAFAVEDRIPPEERPGPVTEEDREAYEDWLFLSKHSDDNKALLPTLNFDHAMVVEWFRNSQYYSPPKKHTAGNRPPFPALLFITRPFRDHRAVINHAFCDHPSATVLSPARYKIVCLHMPDVGAADDGDEVEDGGQAGAEEKVTSADEVPAGDYVRYVDAPKGQFFDVGKPPQYEARGFLWGVAFQRQPRPAPAFAPPPPGKKQRSVLSLWGMGND